MQFLIIRNNGSSVVYWSQIAQCFVKGEEYMALLCYFGSPVMIKESLVAAFWALSGTRHIVCVVFKKKNYQGVKLSTSVV